MSSRFITPFMDVGSGIKPSDGARLFFFDTGTSDPRNTFSDQLATPTPNSNPVISDGTGIFSDIFIDGVYKVVLKDKNNVQIWEADPVISTLQNDLILVTLDTIADAIASSVGVADDYIQTIVNNTNSNRGGARYQLSAADPGSLTFANHLRTDGLFLVLQHSGSITSYEFGCPDDQATDIAANIQAMVDFVAGEDISIIIPNGEYLIGTTINLATVVGPGNRDVEVICGHEAKIYGVDSTVSLFDISGQRRFYWTGGWFRRANVCFDSTGGVSPAYAYFNNVVFEGESTSAIKRCYKSDTSIGVYWNNCLFGTDQAEDQIDIAIEFTGIDIGQTNINKFTDCIFFNCLRGVSMPDSVFPRLQVSFVDCWFESLNGFAVKAGTNTKALAFIRCYFEACGNETEAIIILKNTTMDIEGCQFLGLQNNDDFAIIADEGASINCYGTTEFGSRLNRKFINYTTINGHQNLHGIRIIDQSASGVNDYRTLLYAAPSAASDQFISWSNPALSSTLTDTQLTNISRSNKTFKGFVSAETENVNLPTEGVNVKIAKINVLNAGNGFRVSVESYQTIQGFGHAGKFLEFLVHWTGSVWSVNVLTDANTVAGIVFVITSIDSMSFDISARRTVGGATNTPIKALITIRQAADNMEGNEVFVTSP